MNKLRFSFSAKFWAVYSVGFAAVCFVPMFVPMTLSVQLPVLAAGLFIVFLLFNSFYFSKATAKHSLILSLLGYGMFLLPVVVGYVFSGYLGSQIILSRLLLQFNPILLGLSVIFSILSLSLAVSFESTTKKPVQKNESVPEKNEGQSDNTVKVEMKPSMPQDEPKIKITESEVKDPVVPLNFGYQKPVESESFFDAGAQVDQSCAVESIEKTQTMDVLPNSDMFIFDDNTPVENSDKDKQLNLDMGNVLPDLDLFEVAESPAVDNKAPKNQSVSDDQNFDYFPLKDRVTKKEKDSASPEHKGKISAIGKLLINTKDVENLIDMNENNQDLFQSIDNKQVVSFDYGLQIYEKFNKILVDNSKVRNLSFIDKNSSIIASTYRDNHQRKLVGAIVSCVYGISQNYFDRLNLNGFSQIFFETEKTSDCIIEINGKILYLEAEQGFKSVEYDSFQDVLSQESITVQDFSSLKNKPGFSEAIIADESGALLAHFHSSNPESKASVLAAVFENLKYFITSIHSYNLDKIIIMTEDKAVIIRKYSDKLALFTAENTSFVKVSDDIKTIVSLVSEGN